MAYTTIDNSELYFQTKLYTGNGGTQAITLDGSENMQPDWTWLKCRSNLESHELYDAVRGATKMISSNLTNAETTKSTALTSFNSDGFTLGSNFEVNASGRTFAAWCWKAGTSFTNDASATGVGTIDSTGSISTAAGISIMSYTGTGSNATVGHGLGVAPSMVIVKKTNGSTGWRVYHHGVGATKSLFLDGTEAAVTSNAYFNDTSPTISVFTIGTNSGINASGDTYIAYCFAEKPGYSKFGSYVGNGNANGPFIYTGFKPAFFLVKNITNAGYDWELRDNKRDSYNPVGYRLEANTSDAESSYYAEYDFVSNGIKIRQNGNNYNTSGASYIYMAFAENPFVNSNGVPTNAR